LINPRIAAQRGVDTVEHIHPLVSVLISEDRIGEGLALAGGPTIVDHDRQMHHLPLCVLEPVNYRVALVVRVPSVLANSPTL
jgi:hypothetical protein